MAGETRIVGGKRVEFNPDGSRRADLRPSRSVERPVVIVGGTSYPITKDGVYLVSDGAGNTSISLPNPNLLVSDITIRNSTAGTVTVYPAAATLEGVRTGYVMTTKDLRVMALEAGVWRILGGA